MRKDRTWASVDSYVFSGADNPGCSSKLTTSQKSHKKISGRWTCFRFYGFAVGWSRGCAGRCSYVQLAINVRVGDPDCLCRGCNSPQYVENWARAQKFA